MAAKHKIENTIDLAYELIKQEDDVQLDIVFKRLCSEFNEIKDSDEPFLINLQFQAMAAIIRCQLYADVSDEFVADEIQMIHALDILRESDVLDDAQIRSLYKLAKDVVTECNQYYVRRGIEMPTFDWEKKERPTADDAQQIPRPQIPSHDCYLCHNKNADCKDSHLAPHFLIQPFLSINGSRTRGKEVVTEAMLGSLLKERKWGRSVLPDEIDKTFGQIDETEKEKLKPDALTRDDLFCKNCEQRFSLIESEYADYLAGRKKHISSAISFLFWIGVFWRLSIAGMCFKLSKDDEANIRRILNDYMPSTKKDISNLTPDENWGEMGYVLIHANNTKSELMSLTGNHAQEAPYKLICGPYIIVLYSSIKHAGSKYQVNSWKQAEQIIALPFIEWWKERFLILRAAEKESFSNLNPDSDSQLIDIAKGDSFIPPYFMRGGSISDKDLAEKKYSFTMPGALMRVMKYHEEHPFQSSEEATTGIKEQYGYTLDDIQEMYNFWVEHLLFMPLRTQKAQERHRERQKKAKQKMRTNKKRNRYRKH